MKINYFEGIQLLSNTLGMLNSELVGHHRRVAFIASKIAQQMNLDDKLIKQTLIAGLLHDVGAINRKEIPHMLTFNAMETFNHPTIGFNLLNGVPWLSEVAEIVLYHHTAYSDVVKNSDLEVKVPLVSYIICLADRVDILINKEKNVITQIEQIQNTIRLNLMEMFHPKCVEAFLECSESESFWLDIVNLPLSLRKNYPIMQQNLSLIELKDIAMVCANVIDFRSPFTATHSVGVASVAKALMKLMGGSDTMCDKVEIAGLFHDLGKLVIPLNILEKPELLTSDEFKIMKTHTYYTHLAMDISEGLEEIQKWSSYHHEKVDGTGYPFGKAKDEIPMEAKIISVADIFTALIEDRPYRTGMAFDQVLNILQEMANDQSICLEVVEVLIEHSNEILDDYMTSQEKYKKEYNFISDLIA